MELDELKGLFEKAADKPATPKQNIINMITLESQGPLALLKKQVTYNLYIFPAFIVVYAVLFMIMGVVHLFPLALLFIILFAEFAVSAINYFTITKMQTATGNVKENLLNKVKLLKLRFKWHFIMHNVLYWLMPILMELDAHYHFDGQFLGWAKINVLIRFAFYIFVFGPLYFIFKEFEQQKYGQYLDKLTNLLHDLE